MYKIYADDTLIYDSTLEDFKISKGSVALETNKSGSFVFAIYPDHFFYDDFIKLKTVITVYKSNKIVFRGRVLNDITDYWNNKVLTCEGELGFLQDSVIRPYSYSGSVEGMLKKFIDDHNSQVDDFKKFKLGKVTVTDNNNYIGRVNSGYESTFDNIKSRLLEDATGGYLYITHGSDGRDKTPTINYLADFTDKATQSIEFGSNLMDYTKTAAGEDIATAIIPLGHEVDNGNPDVENPRLTITSVNSGKDYIYDSNAVALRGWIIKSVTWDDVTDASNLLNKAKSYLKSVINQSITIELTAIDLHLLNKSIESFKIGEYIHVFSKPHNFNSSMLCNKQTIDLLKPENDTVTLGYTYSTFTERTGKISSTVNMIRNVNSTVNHVSNQVINIGANADNANTNASQALSDYAELNKTVTELITNVSANKENIDAHSTKLSDLEKRIAALEEGTTEENTEDKK